MFTDEQYKAFEYHTQYQAERTEVLKAYNEKHGTSYKYYFEYIHKRRQTWSDLAQSYGG